jgi:hypothetical protein
MKRYIEIVFDNSGSMDTLLNEKTRLESAKELFESTILPTIGFPEDKVVLRLLRNDCWGVSSAEILANNRAAMRNRINNIQAYGSTPLYQTVKDAVEGCKAETAKEKFIFVLTDGGDTCNDSMESLIGFEDQQYILKLNVLLMQFAIENSATKNNLTAFSNFLGARTFSIGSGGRTSPNLMRADLRKALILGGLASAYPLEHCFTEMVGEVKTWNELIAEGFDFYKATLLYEESILSWKPQEKDDVTPLQQAELDFLVGLRFNTALPKEIVLTMLSQLKKPYYYSMNCIFWDFINTKWKYHTKPNQVVIVDDPESEVADKPNSTNHIFAKNHNLQTKYHKEVTYEVLEIHNLNEKNAPQSEKFYLEELPSEFKVKGRITKLKPGQLVKFVKVK